MLKVINSISYDGSFDSVRGNWDFPPANFFPVQELETLLWRRSSKARLCWALISTKPQPWLAPLRLVASSYDTFHFLSH